MLCVALTKTGELVFNIRRIESLNVAMLAALVLLGLPAAAQEAPVPEKGAWNVSFSFPNGGGSSFGLSTMVAPSWSLGLVVDLQSSDSDINPTEGSIAASSEVDDREFLIGPVLKKYFRSRGSVAPFLRSSVALGWTNRETRQTNAERVFDTFTYSGRLGVGADWFPLEGISLGGFTGVLVTRVDVTSTLNDLGITQDTWAVTTFTSDLVLRIWF